MLSFTASFPAIALATCAATLPLFAHEGAHPEPVAYEKKLEHAPRPLPDRVVLTWDADPATTQAVTWRTDTSVSHGLAEIALANEDGRALVPTRVEASTTEFTSDLNVAHYHTARFTDLQPDTLYTYRVGDSVNWSEWFHFRTASREAKPFTFVYFGDAQNDIKTHWSRVFREAFRDAPRAAFTLHAGDLINEDASDAEWGEWHGAPGWVNGTVPVIAAPGNHEYFREGQGPEEERLWATSSGEAIRVDVTIERHRDSSGQTTGYRVDARTPDGKHRGVLTLDGDEKITGVEEGITRMTGFRLPELAGTEYDDPPLDDRIAVQGIPAVSRHWRPQFAFPEQDVPERLEETCYYIDYQGARIVVLDSNQQREAQVAWLRRVLESSSAQWTILTFHHPVFSPARNRDNAELRKLWKPLLDEFKVDLVLTGHDHTYARTGDLSARTVGTNVPSGVQTYDPSVGTVYVVSVSGPKMYDITNENFVRTAEDTQLYQIIRVENDELHYEARTAIGRLYDAFTLKKRDGEPNELIESLPSQRRRQKE
jgi:3',5'-cyclic AMP phosphodiesterase CpdA